MRNTLRLGVAAVVASLVATACFGGGGAPSQRTVDTYEINLLGEATAGGKLVLAAPAKIEIPVAEGLSATELALSIRDELQRRGYNVICTIDRRQSGFAVVVQGRVEISSAKSELGGVGGTASQVIERAGVIESTVREYMRTLRDNSSDGLRRWVTDSFYERAAKDLGRGGSIVNLRTPSIGCHSSAVVVEMVYPGGGHVEQELRLITEDGHAWRVQDVRILAEWAERSAAAVRARPAVNKATGS